MENEIASYLVEKMAAVAEPECAEGLTFPQFDLDWRSGDRTALFDKATQSMRKNGCVILRNFLSSAGAGVLLASLEEVLSREEIATHIDNRMDYETDDYLINCTFQRFPRGEKVTPTTLFRLGKTIFNVRVGNIGPAGDDGLIDISLSTGPFPNAGRYSKERAATNSSSGSCGPPPDCPTNRASSTSTTTGESRRLEATTPTALDQR